MTNTEACAVNVLLTHILGRGPWQADDEGQPSPDEVRKATEILAAKAFKALYAGWSPEMLAKVWKTKDLGARREAFLTSAKRRRAP